MKSVICETSRLYLRKFEDSDAEALLPILGDPEVMRFSVHGPENAQGVQKFLDGTKKRYERDGIGLWAVILKGNQSLIGECGITTQSIDGITEYEIGYRIARCHWGNGLATEAALASRDYGFLQLGLRRLISIIESENRASIRVAQKIGMDLEKESTFHAIPVRIYSVENSAR